MDDSPELTVLSNSKNWAGRIVAQKYRLMRWLGSSDHSAAFETQLSGSEPRPAAIKLVAQDTASDERLSSLRELSRLSHPNLIQILESGPCELDGAKLIYVVMEFADEDLSQILPQRALTPAETREFLQPTLDALLYLHERGFVHGRICPSNIRAAGDRIKLSTDSVRKASSPRAPLINPSPYNAPEALSGKFSAASDIWGIGATIVAALTQWPPQLDSSGDAQVPKSLPEPFQTLARECLRKDPETRCKLSDISAILQGKQPATPARSAPAAARSSPGNAGVPESANRSRPFVILAVCIVLLVVAILAFRSFRIARDSTASVSTPAEPQTSQPPSPQPEPAAPMNRANKEGAVLHQFLPDVPRSARHTIHGKIKVAVRVNVDSRGKVASEKLTSPGPSHYFAGVAERAAERWEFSPPQSDGQSTPSVWLLRFQFTRNGTQVFPEQERR